MSIKIKLHAKMKVDAEIGDFIIHTDQKTADGGDGSAPPPFDLFLASIGTCAGAYIIGFCKNRNLPYHNIEIEQKLIYSTEKKRIEKIALNIILPPEIPEKYHSAIINTANNCAVKKYILNPPEFETNIV